MENEKGKNRTKQASLEQEVDYYFENGLMVLTEHYLKKRGYCCGNKCRHCPYEHENVPSHKK